MKKYKIAYIKKEQKYNCSRFKEILKKIRELFVYYDQEGFFEASINQFFKVKYFDYSKAIKHIEKINNNYKYLIVNQRCSIGENRNDNILNLVKHSQIPKILFIGSDRVDFMPSDGFLNNFDLVIKREPYKNLSKYNISEENQKKIIKTMLPCLLKLKSKNFIGDLFAWFYSRNYRYIFPGDRGYKYDTSFIGSMSNSCPHREKVVEILENTKKISFFGGLLDNGKLKAPKNLKFNKKLPFNRFVELINHTRINLALEGWGEFTFRHLEILSLGGFLLSSNSITELDLPIKLIKNIDYVVFRDYNDMINKVNFYLQNEEKRNRIALSGKEKFDKYYNYKLHGEYLYQKITELNEKK